MHPDRQIYDVNGDLNRRTTTHDNRTHYRITEVNADAEVPAGDFCRRMRGRDVLRLHRPLWKLLLWVAMHGSTPGGPACRGAWDCVYRVEQGASYRWPDFAHALPVTDEHFCVPKGPQPEFVVANHPTESPPRPVARSKPTPPRTASPSRPRSADELGAVFAAHAAVAMVGARQREHKDEAIRTRDAIGPSSAPPLRARDFHYVALAKEAANVDRPASG